MSDKREKRLLIERKKPKTILGIPQVEEEEQKERYEKDIENRKPVKEPKQVGETKSYEQHKKDEENSWLNKTADAVGGPIVSAIEDAGKVASKVGDFLRRQMYEFTTPRYVKDRDKVIDKKVKGKSDKDKSDKDK